MRFCEPRFALVVCPEERFRIAENTPHPHALSDGGHRHASGGQCAEQGEMSSDSSFNLITDIESVLPQPGVLAVKLVERQFRREHGMGDVKQLPILRLNRRLSLVPKI